MVANSTNDNDIVKLLQLITLFLHAASNLGTTQDVAKSVLQMATASEDADCVITALSNALNENAVNDSSIFYRY